MTRVSSLAAPAFPDDDGAVDPDVAAALADFSATGRLGEVILALGRTRVIVAVVAVAEGEPGDTVRTKEADMAAVLLTGADGRTALLAFSGLATLQRWNPDARPVPVRLGVAAAAAVAEGAAAIVVDLAGPVRAVIETDDLGRLAAGEQLVRTSGGLGWTSPESSARRSDHSPADS